MVRAAEALNGVYVNLSADTWSVEAFRWHAQRFLLLNGSLEDFFENDQLFRLKPKAHLLLEAASPAQYCSCVYSQMFYTTPFHALWGIFASYFLAPAARTCHALGVQFKAMFRRLPSKTVSNVQAFAEQNCQKTSTGPRSQFGFWEFSHSSSST